MMLNSKSIIVNYKRKAIMKTVDQIIDEVIGKEGRYANNAKDKGGETMWGITEAVARANGYSGPMKDMPRTVAANIYRVQYVQVPGFDKVLTVSPALAAEMVDTGVNMGTAIPGPWLQRWLNVFNKEQTLYPDLKADGQIGPMTISALKTFLKTRGVEGEAVLVKAMNCSQGARYLEITEKREANEEFVYGWILNRVTLPA